METTDKRYVLMNLNSPISFLLADEYETYHLMNPEKKCTEINTGRYSYCQIYDLKDAMRYANKATAQYILERYNRHTFHQTVPDFNVVEVKVKYEL